MPSTGFFFNSCVIHTTNMMISTPKRVYINQLIYFNDRISPSTVNAYLVPVSSFILFITFVISIRISAVVTTEPVASADDITDDVI